MPDLDVLLGQLLLGELVLDLVLDLLGEVALDADAVAVELPGVEPLHRPVRRVAVLLQLRFDVEAEDVAVAHRRMLLPRERQPAARRIGLRIDRLVGRRLRRLRRPCSSSAFFSFLAFFGLLVALGLLARPAPAAPARDAAARLRERTAPARRRAAASSRGERAQTDGDQHSASPVRAAAPAAVASPRRARVWNSSTAAATAAGSVDDDRDLATEVEAQRRQRQAADDDGLVVERA